MAINVTLLKNVKDMILINPGLFDMDDWRKCIGGIVLGIEFWTLTPSFTDEHARHALRLDDDQADRLFFVWRWPKQFQVENAERSAPNCIARIEHFILTDGRE